MLAMVGMVFGFTVATAFAQMGGGTMGGRDSKDGMGYDGFSAVRADDGQPDDEPGDDARQVRHDVPDERVSGTMQQGADMDHTKMMNLSKMMDAMSVNMKAGDVSGRRSGRKTQGSHGAGGRWRYEMRALHQGIYENGVTGRRDAGRAAGVSECRDDRRRLSRRTMGIEGL